MKNWIKVLSGTVAGALIGALLFDFFFNLLSTSENIFLFRLFFSRSRLRSTSCIDRSSFGKHSDGRWLFGVL